MYGTRHSLTTRNYNMNIGDTVEYNNIYNEKKSGKLVDISSDMDSYDQMKLEDGVPLYYSKKLSRFVPVKEKNMKTIFLTVENVGNNRYSSVKDFVSFNEVGVLTS